MSTNQMQVPGVLAIQLRRIECADETRQVITADVVDEVKRMIAEGASDDQLATTIKSWGQATNQMQVPILAIQFRRIECADEARRMITADVVDEVKRMITEGASDDQLATTINSWGQADQDP